jgi:hypothetical protein
VTETIALRAIATPTSGDDVLAIVGAAERLRDEVVRRERIRWVAFRAAVRTPRLRSDDFAREPLPVGAVATFGRGTADASALVRSLALATTGAAMDELAAV